MSAETIAELSEDDAMGAVWDEMTAEAVADSVEPPKSVAEPEEPDGEADVAPVRDEKGRFVAQEAEEAPAEAAEEAPADTAPQAPGHLPREVKEVWKDIPEAAQKRLSESYQDFSRRISEAEQVTRAAKPVYDKLVQAAQELPQLKDMRPEDIAVEVFELSKWAQKLNVDPISALIEVAEHRGVTEALRQKFAGQEQPDAVAYLQREVATLRKALDSQPEANLQTQIAQEMQTARVAAEVEAFAQSKHDWGVLEPHILDRLPAFRDANPGLSPKEVLELTYDTLAGEMLSPLRSAAAEDAGKARKAEAARAAAAVNIKGNTAAGKDALTDDEVMSQIWARNHG